MISLGKSPDWGYFTPLERHLTLAMPLSTQEYKWVLESCWRIQTECWEVGNPTVDYRHIQGE